MKIESDDLTRPAVHGLLDEHFTRLLQQGTCRATIIFEEDSMADPVDTLVIDVLDRIGNRHRFPDEGILIP